MCSVVTVIITHLHAHAKSFTYSHTLTQAYTNTHTIIHTLTHTQRQSDVFDISAHSNTVYSINLDICFYGNQTAFY